MISSYGNNSGPLVSVLISTYNRPRYVAEAVESILRQTYTNFEIVLVRDGGLPVRDAIRRFDDPRLKFIDRDENKGKAYSLNEAFKLAHGKYICYLDDDDIFYPFHIETLVNAIESDQEFGLVYSDLYKSHCRVEEDGCRTVLSKNIEVSRDFDRMSLCRFNHILHVSIIHRRDLLERAGGYNEDIDVLIDWDLTRKLSFYTDFKHVCDVTGEYYGPVGDCDRISVQKRKNPTDYLMNLCKIRNTRPPKPWEKVKDLSIIIPADRYDEQLKQKLREIWIHTFYPHRIFVTLPHVELAKINSFVPFTGVGVDIGISVEERIKAAVECCDGDYVAIVPVDYSVCVEGDESPWIESSLQPMLNSKDPMEAYEMLYSSQDCRSAVFRKEQLDRIVSTFGSGSWYETSVSSGVKFKKPTVEEFPLQFDFWMGQIDKLEGQGQWGKATKLFEYLKQNYQNSLWMLTRCANAFHHAGDHDMALRRIDEVNSVRQTAGSLLIEARINKSKGNSQRAIEFYGKAESVLSSSEFVRAS